ncbi:MAG: ATP-binding protein, partial [Pseudomonadales bacterium]|nr:ATP-binding protein [Pseudomonadales bacterium]
DHSVIRCKLLIDKHNKLEADDLELRRSDFPKYFHALDSERTITAHNALSDPSTVEFAEVYLQPLGITSMLDTPIRHRGDMIGVICSEHIGHARTWTEDEVTFSGALADLYGRAVSAAQRRDFELALQEANAELEAKVASRTQELSKVIEELKKAQSHLVESEKMAALGALVAGVAHEVNTPLGVSITAVSHLDQVVLTLQRSYEAGALDENAFLNFLEEYRYSSALVHSNLDRAAKLVSDFKQTAVDQSSDVLEGFSPARHLERLLSSLRPLYKRHQVQIILDIDPAIRLYSFPGALSQIVTNLVSNSCVHGFGVSQGNQIIIKGTLEDADFVLTYKDNGRGLTPEIRQKMFEPFFTTTRSGGGTGLGMSIVYNLTVQKLKGRIDVIPCEHGAEFQFQIPQSCAECDAG